MCGCGAAASWLTLAIGISSCTPGAVSAQAPEFTSLPPAGVFNSSSRTFDPGEPWSSVGSPIMPYFDNATAKNITTQLGQTAYLHCLVHNLGDKTVLWIRKKDFHVLTVGLDTYTSDTRFQAIHLEASGDWALQIRFAQLRDAGIYECQVSSDPKISFFVNLNVVVAKAAIENAPEIYLKTGSAINLTCVITQSPEPPVFVFWYQDDRMINYDSRRGHITTHKAGEDTAISRIFIRNAHVSDSGNYTCCPSNAEPTSITVHVLNGEKQAAMQHDGSPSHCPGLRASSCLALTAWLAVILAAR